MSHYSPIVKAKRKSITLETKIKILDLLAEGNGPTAVGKQFGYNEATIRTIKKNETAIRNSVCSGMNVRAKSASYKRSSAKEKMERALVMWIEDNTQRGIKMNANDVKQNALRIYKSFKEDKPSTSSRSKRSEFGASTCWLSSFLKRYNITNITDYLTYEDIKKLDNSLSESEIMDLSPETYHPIEHCDINEIDPPLVLNTTLIKEGLDIAWKLGNHFEQHDPDKERSAKFQHELRSLMASYRKLYNDLSREERLEFSIQESTHDEQNNSSDISDVVDLLSDSDDE